jgi:hypothetical protein
MMKQVILLSDDEKSLFELQYKSDILGIQEAADINK